MAKHFFGLRTHQYAGNISTPFGSHNHHVDLFFLGCFDQFCKRYALFNDESIGDPGAVRLRQQALHLFGAVCLETIDVNLH